jgi:hypothetical protein
MQHHFVANFAKKILLRENSYKQRAFVMKKNPVTSSSNLSNPAVQTYSDAWISVQKWACLT